MDLRIRVVLIIIVALLILLMTRIDEVVFGQELDLSCPDFSGEVITETTEYYDVRTKIRISDFETESFSSRAVVFKQAVLLTKSGERVQVISVKGEISPKVLFYQTHLKLELEAFRWQSKECLKMLFKKNDQTYYFVIKVGPEKITTRTKKGQDGFLKKSEQPNQTASVSVVGLFNFLTDPNRTKGQIKLIFPFGNSIFKVKVSPVEAFIWAENSRVRSFQGLADVFPKRTSSIWEDIIENIEARAGQGAIEWAKASYRFRILWRILPVAVEATITRASEEKKR